MSQESNFKQLQNNFRQNFSLGNLGSDFTNKIALMSFICFLTMKARESNPDASCYQVLMKILDNTYEGTDFMIFIKGLAVTCEDYMYGCNSFPLFGLKTSKEIVTESKRILNQWLPF